jgi:hypothetical protein
MKTTIVHTPTQKAFDEVMEFVKSIGKCPLRSELWLFEKQKTCVRLTDEEVDSCDKNFYKTYHLYQDIPIISLKQFKDKMKTKTKQKKAATPAAKKSAIQKAKRSGDVVDTIKTVNKGKWEIYNPEIGNTGKYDRKVFNTRLISRNGHLLNEGTGFNTKRNAKDNINATIRTGFIMPPKLLTALKKAKTDQGVLDAIAAFLKCCPK